jgi:hypothetical protein
MEKEKSAESEYQEFINCLNKHKVEYLLIGAYAVIKHTRIARMTKDIDFWINGNLENAKNTAAAIKDFIGIEVEPKDLIVKNEVYYIGRPPRRIDIFCNQADISYEESYRKRVTGKFLEADTAYISIDDLIKVKNHYKDKENAEKYEKDIKRLEVEKEKKKSRGFER